MYILVDRRIATNESTESETHIVFRFIIRAILTGPKRRTCARSNDEPFYLSQTGSLEHMFALHRTKVLSERELTKQFWKTCPIFSLRCDSKIHYCLISCIRIPFVCCLTFQTDRSKRRPICSFGLTWWTPIHSQHDGWALKTTLQNCQNEDVFSHCRWHAMFNWA